LPCTQNSSYVFYSYSKGKKTRVTENQAEKSAPTLLKKEGREEEGTSNTLLGNTKLLLWLHKNEAEHNSANNRNSYFRS